MCIEIGTDNLTTRRILTGQWPLNSCVCMPMHNHWALFAAYHSHQWQTPIMFHFGNTTSTRTHTHYIRFIKSNVTLIKRWCMLAAPGFYVVESKYDAYICVCVCRYAVVWPIDKRIMKRTLRFYRFKIYRCGKSKWCILITSQSTSCPLLELLAIQKLHDWNELLAEE